MIHYIVEQRTRKTIYHQGCATDQRRNPFGLSLCNVRPEVFYRNAIWPWSKLSLKRSSPTVKASIETVRCLFVLLDGILLGASRLSDWHSHATCKTQINLAKCRARSGFTNTIAGQIVSSKLDALGIKCTNQAILFHHSMSSQRSILFKRERDCVTAAHVSTFCTCSRGPRSPLRRHNRKRFAMTDGNPSSV